jgi:hypothetical protein
METYLRCFVNACPKQWGSWLSLAEFWYNSSFHSSLGCSPFEALYGYPPRHFGLSAVESCQSVSLDQWLQQRRLMTDLVKQHLNRVVTRMKNQADKGHTERQFQAGESVFLKLQPYVQSSLATRANQKLSFKFFGPYTIVQKVGSVAYKLDLPAASSVHPVFHVSQLKKVVGVTAQVSQTLPPDLPQLQIPVKILERRLVTKGVHSVHQVPVQWSSSPEALATWEDLAALKQKFPDAPAWGQAGSVGRGIVSSSGTDDVLAGTDDDRSGGFAAKGPVGTRARRPNPRVSGPECVSG